MPSTFLLTTCVASCWRYERRIVVFEGVPGRFLQDEGVRRVIEEVKVLQEHVSDYVVCVYCPVLHVAVTQARTRHATRTVCKKHSGLKGP